MLGNLSGWHLVIILFIILLLFGAPKLPGLARSVGQSLKIFKKEVSGDASAEGTETAESVADSGDEAPAAKKTTKKAADKPAAKK